MFQLSFRRVAKTMSSRVAQLEMSTKLALWKMMVWKMRSLQEPVGREKWHGVLEDERGGQGAANSSVVGGPGRQGGLQCPWGQAR